MAPASEDKIYAYIDYEDTYVQPLILAALKARLPPDILVLLDPTNPIPPVGSKFLQWRQYESIDFDNLLANPRTSLANSYIIRKALIRKHYLSTTVSHWLSKHPDSVLARSVKQGVEFEVDYAEFLDDALVEAWELKASWERNEELGEGREGEREWWILKAGMGERGQGVRLFSSEEELVAIFEEWEPESSDEEEEEEEDDGEGNGDDDEAEAQHSGNDDAGSSITPPPASHIPTTKPNPTSSEEGNSNNKDNAIITTHLRHFIAQPYIHPPLLLPSPHPSADRKFHIRTYILCSGALKVFVYKPMLALFAATPYAAPSTENAQELAMHLTNTCLQSGEREGSVCDFWGLPSIPTLASASTSSSSSSAATTAVDTSSSVSSSTWQDDIFTQICAITGETFRAAATTMSIHFQPLPNSFEVFGLDFMVDAEGSVWLLEVNAFPDFAQTGGELRGVVEGLVEAVVEVGVKRFFFDGDDDGKDCGGKEREEKMGMIEVLDLDMGRR